jgi:SynChlorMet cassette radical SAM/SPASM protein ScmE
MPTISNPKRCDIAITGRCNLNCRYCYYADEMAANDDLPAEYWISFFDQLEQLKVMEVGLTGGEVFLRPDLFELIDAIIQHRMRYNICTNGTLINESVLANFDVGKRRLRLNTIQLSVDGSCAEIHNLSRPDSFDRVIPALRLLKSRQFPVDVRVTINKHNLNDLENIAKLLLDDVGLPSFSTGEAFSMGMGCANEAEVTLTSEDRFAAIQSLDRILKKYPLRIIAQAGPQAKLQTYTEMEEARRTGIKTTRWGMGYLTGCGCVFHRIDVLHNGNIVPCLIMHELVMGNIRTDSLGEIWQNHPYLLALRKRRTIPMDEVTGCENCEWLSFCNGSCPGLAQEANSDFNNPSLFDCYRHFLKENGEETRQYFQNRIENQANRKGR